MFIHFTPTGIWTLTITNDVTDMDQLKRMARKAKEVLEVESLEVLADKDYYNRMRSKSVLTTI